MSEAIIVAIVGVAGTIGGAMTTNMFAAAKNRLISIHALHEESDASLETLLSNIKSFQSTLSMRRAT